MGAMRDWVCPNGECGALRAGKEALREHIAATHPRRYRVGGCQTCDYDPDEQRAMPPHDASYRCESGWHTHCSCSGSCF